MRSTSGHRRRVVALKPYGVKFQGLDGPVLKQFSTLKQLQRFVFNHWDGVLLIDGPTSWHTDFTSYELVGAQLSDIGRIVDDVWIWIKLQD